MSYAKTQNYFWASNWVLLYTCIYNPIWVYLLCNPTVFLNMFCQCKESRNSSKSSRTFPIMCTMSKKIRQISKFSKSFFKMNPIFKIPVHVLVFLYCICVLQHFVSIPYKSLMQCQLLVHVLLIGRQVCN